ncbi:exodeoxyribonuclease VII large subunit [Granulicoccus phenolivorans]|uniref:exodeoxyribonuclease VII large subunit n=1 Tax=Granulicoccus phenolivorans TaxID=266854 RepID=UPI0003FC912B|nr:exodeoxyribonuclease VII large subunit [Granulicoccus phenolivorans]
MAMTSSPEQPQPLRAVVQAVKGWVERLGWIWVEGQVIQIKRRAGQLHFLTLRDRHAEVSVTVTVTTAVLDAAGPLTEGATVVCELRPNVFAKSGSLSFVCQDLRPAGEGRLLAQLEQRKRSLQQEGLFDRTLKKRLPFLPRRIGLVAGRDSDAERDVIENVRRRWPAAVFEVRHCLVQGPRAAEQVMEAVHALDRMPEVDVIVVARGGGALEDLLPFSDEGLARTVFAARTPVVSAIGHESDTPILDLVADVRASTPTDAARRIVPDVREESAGLAQIHDRLERAIISLVSTELRQLTHLRSRPALTNPLYGFDLRHAEVTALRDRGLRAVEQRARAEQTRLDHALQTIRTLSPKRTLERGYAILLDGAGQGVTSVTEVDPGDDLQVHLADGDLIVEVRDVDDATRPDSDLYADPEEGFDA